VAEQRRLEDRVEDAGVVDARGAGAREGIARDRPRPLGELDRQPREEPDAEVRVALTDRVRIGDDRARERVMVRIRPGWRAPAGSAGALGLMVRSRPSWRASAGALGLIGEGGTQKLCVSGRSIEALIEA
jgi:hypothetical protein